MSFFSLKGPEATPAGAAVDQLVVDQRVPHAIPSEE